MLKMNRLRSLFAHFALTFRSILRSLFAQFFALFSLNFSLAFGHQGIAAVRHPGQRHQLLPYEYTELLRYRSSIQGFTGEREIERARLFKPIFWALFGHFREESLIFGGTK